MTSWLGEVMSGAGGFGLATLIQITREWIQDRRNRAHKIDDTDSRKLARLMAATEIHITQYDVPLRELVGRLHSAINRLEANQGMPLTEFPALPNPVPLLTALHEDPPEKKGT